MPKTAIITGVSGQDGSYLAELLLDKGYRVIGVTNSADPNKRENIAHIDNLELAILDIRDSQSIAELIKSTKPDEYYNLAAQSFVGSSWDLSKTTYEINALSVLYALEAIKNFSPQTRFYQASTSEMFGKVQETPQRETTPFYPRSPYGVSKLSAHWMVVNYRESFGLYAVSGILFNHESPRRGEQFVTRKITRAVAAIEADKQKELRLGNLDAKRDWGYAGDFVEGMYLMLQQEEPEDFVLATGETHSIKEFLYAAFSCVGLDWQDYVIIDQEFYRPAEVDILVGDATKAKEKLGWKPKVSFTELVHMMVKTDLKNL